MNKTVLRFIVLFIALNFIACSNDDDGYSDAEYVPIQSCTTPLIAEITAISASSVSISWTGNSTATSYIVFYGESGFTPNNSDGIEVDSNTYIISNLSPNTTYDFYVKAVCSKDLESELSTLQSLNTPCLELTFTGDVVLSTQQELDNFSAGCYRHIEGSLTIGSTGSDIISLAGLSNLKTISEYLTIEENGQLPSIEGLEGLEYVEFGLSVINNDILESLNGIQPLIQRMDDFYEIYLSDNDALTTLNLEDLTNCSGLYIYDNDSLSNLNSLNNLIELTDILAIRNNNTLNDFCDLENLFINGTIDLNLVDIKNNLYNPTAEDIANGNCSH